MTRRNRDADILSHRLERASAIIPEIFDHLDEQRANVFASKGGGEGGRQVGTHSDPTMRQVMLLDGIDNHERTIRDALASINVGVNLLDEACRNALGSRVKAAADEPRCAGGDSETWGDTTCGDLVGWYVSPGGHVAYDRDGLCPTHRAKVNEWVRRADESNARRLRRHRQDVA